MIGTRVAFRGAFWPHEGTQDAQAAEFQKILDHRGIVISDPIGALAHLQLTRAYAAAGDKAKAKFVFQDFLTSAKTPIPISPS
jgi:hypothetical protein